MRWIGGVAVVAGSLVLATAPVQAGNNWGLPLLGGAVGGYALSSVLHSTKSKPAPQPTHTAVAPPAPAAPTVESRLHELDQLAAGGYITKQEYDQRRKVIIDSL